MNIQNIDFKNPKLQRYVAIGLFAFLLLQDLLDGGFALRSLLVMAALAMMGVSLYLDKKILAAVAGGITAGCGVLGFLSILSSYSFFIEMDFYEPIFGSIATLVYNVAFALMIPAALKPQEAKRYGRLAGGIALGATLFGIILGPFSLKFFSLLGRAAYCGALTLSGMVMDSSNGACAPAAAAPAGTVFTPPVNNAPVHSAPAAPSFDEKVEKLSKLKSLLDADIITQEEFDSKKKQILDL